MINNICSLRIQRFITFDQWVAWPSGLRRWFKAPVSSEAWVRIPPLPNFFRKAIVKNLQRYFCKIQCYRNLIPSVVWTYKLPNSSNDWLNIFTFYSAYKQEKQKVRAHSDLNQGPIGLQPIALPLSYRPTASEYTVHWGLYNTGIGWWNACNKIEKIICQKWDLNPRPHTRTRILTSSLSESKGFTLSLAP